MALSKGWLAFALELQEAAAAGLAHSDLHSWLSDACNKENCSYLDCIGDGTSGDVIVHCWDGGSTKKRIPYEIRSVNGKKAAVLDMDNATPVLGTTTYSDKADEDDDYASMEAERKAAKLYTELPFYERFISKAERDAADSGSFAGKGKSFPILKPGDVSAAVHAMGRAGPDNHSTATLKKNIIAIAKKKGWTSSLPKAWQGGDDSDSSEAAVIAIDGEFVALKEGAVGQDGTAYLKLISPGHGSSGYYPEKVLERDGPKVFPKGTKNFWNHPTDAEEAARPEGDLRDLASVLTENAHYEPSGPAGPGLYARAEVQPAFRGSVDSLAKHIGMSIRASGKAREGKAPDGKQTKIIEELTKGISVDYVTTPGAGGQILQLFEAARGGQSNPGGADDMDAATVQRLQESNRKLALRLARTEAREAATAKLAGIRLPEDRKQAVMARCIESATITTEGEFDATAFNALLEREIKYAGTLLGEAEVIGMGAPGAGGNDPAKEAEAFEARYKETVNDLAEALGFDSKEGKKHFREGRAA